MRDLDDTDRELLRLLLDDARRPYSELADHVELSPPAVSDRIDRLRELGIIRRFTAEIDRSRLQDGVRLAVTFETAPGETATVRAAVSATDSVEHVFTTADGVVFVVATLPSGDVDHHFATVFETEAVVAVDVSPLVSADWHPELGEATLGLTCAECANTVTSEGVSAEIGDRSYEFCCGSCLSRFRERYKELEAGA